MDTTKETFGYCCGTCIHFHKLLRYRVGECTKIENFDELSETYFPRGVDTDTYYSPMCEEFRHKIIQNEEKNFGKDYKLPFGKYKGNTVYGLITKDVNYCKWLLKNTQNAVIWTIIKHYFEEMGILEE